MTARVDNALNQAAKELATRFDFRGTDTPSPGRAMRPSSITSSTEERVKAAVDVFKEKLVRRDISMKAFDAGDPQASGKTYKVTGTLKQGIDSENAKKITKLIRDEGPKGVKSQIQGDEVRVSSKKRDDLQAVIAMLKKADLDVALQFVNYRCHLGQKRCAGNPTALLIERMAPAQSVKRAKPRSTLSQVALFSRT